MTKIKVTLMKSFEYEIDRLAGADLAEKTKSALSTAKYSFYRLLARKAVKPLMETEVTVLNN